MIQSIVTRLEEQAKISELIHENISCRKVEVIQDLFSNKEANIIKSNTPKPIREGRPIGLELLKNKSIHS